MVVLVMLSFAVWEMERSYAEVLRIYGGVLLVAHHIYSYLLQDVYEWKAVVQSDSGVKREPHRAARRSSLRLCFSLAARLL